MGTCEEAGEVGVQQGGSTGFQVHVAMLRGFLKSRSKPTSCHSVFYAEDGLQSVDFAESVHLANSQRRTFDCPSFFGRQ